MNGCVLNNCPASFTMVVGEIVAVFWYQEFALNFLRSQTGSKYGLVGHGFIIGFVTVLHKTHVTIDEYKLRTSITILPKRRKP